MEVFLIDKAAMLSLMTEFLRPDAEKALRERIAYSMQSKLQRL